MAIRRVLKQLYVGIAIYVAVFAVLGIFLMRPLWLFEVSLLVGGLAACFLVYHIYDCLDRALDMQAKNAKSFVTIRSLLRLLIRSALLIGAVLIHWVSFVGVAVGLLAPKVSAYFNPYIDRALTGGDVGTQSEIEGADVNNTDVKNADAPDIEEP